MQGLLYGVAPEPQPEPAEGNHLLRGLSQTPMRLVDHRLGNIDPDDLGPRVVVVEGEPGADPDLQNEAPNRERGLCGRPPALEKNGAADRIIDRSPAGVRLLHHPSLRIGYYALNWDSW